MTDPCKNESRWERHEALLRKLDTGRHAAYQWLMISAAIAVLLLTWHQFRVIVQMSGIAGLTAKSIADQNVMIVEQNRILNSMLRESIAHNKQHESLGADHALPKKQRGRQ